eukprot:scaffold358_cov343-Pavlova_lutheri.AAC.59
MALHSALLYPPRMMEDQANVARTISRVLASKLFCIREPDKCEMTSWPEYCKYASLKQFAKLVLHIGPCPC